MAVSSIELSLRASAAFFRSEIKDLDAATDAVIKTSAQKLKTEMHRQVKQKFKPGPNSNKSFFKGFKVYDLDADGSRGPASYVRAGVPFLHVFEEGATIRPKQSQHLVVLTPDGEKLGFRRITKSNSLRKLFTQYPTRKLRLIPARGSKPPMILYDIGGRWVAVYVYLKQVKMPRRLSFYASAEAIADTMPEAIARLLGES